MASKDFSVEFDPRLLLGLDADALKLQDPASLQEQTIRAIEKRYGPSQGKITVELLPSGRLLVVYKPTRIDDRAEQLHRRGITAAKRKDLKQAIHDWTAAAQLNPSEPKYFFHAGVGYFEIGDYEKAATNLLQTIDLCSFHHKALLVLGTLYLKLRKLDKAERFLEASVEIAPNNALGHLNLGAVYSVERKYEQGIKEFEKAIRLAPDDPRPYLGLAKVHSLLGQTERAEYYYRQVIKLDKAGILRQQAQHNMASIRAERGPTQEEMAALRRAVAATEAADRAQTTAGKEVGPGAEGTEEAGGWPADPGRFQGSDPDTLFASGYHAYLNLDYVAAADFYAGYAALRPADAAGWYALGEALLRRGDLVGAARAFRKAVEVDEQPTFLKQLGLVKLLQGDFATAKATLSRARELGKRDSVTSYLYGRCLTAEGNFADAIIALEQAIRSNRNNLAARLELSKALLENDELDLALQRLDELLTIPVDSPVKDEAAVLRDQILAKKERQRPF